MDLQREDLVRALHLLGEVLEDRGQTFEVAIIGGAALLLERWVARTTDDVDVVAVAAAGTSLDPSLALPQELAAAVEDTARTLGLDHGWLNTGALAVMREDLPEGYENRLRTRRFGGLTVSVLSRQDLIRLKLHAATDEGPGSPHVADLRSMLLTDDELEEAVAWLLARHPLKAGVELDDVVAALRSNTRG